MAAGVTVSSAHYPKDLFGADNFPSHPKQVILLGNQTLNQSGALTTTTARIGTVVGQVTTSGKFVIVNSANTDGSQTPKGILVNDYETANGDQVATIWVSGSFKISKLLFGGTDTFATHKTNLEALNIYGEGSQPVGVPYP